jgi:8-oxo-dGTP pyrophosphatase MutT (NUDIX family)
VNDFLPLPAAMIERARTFTGPAAVARPAATVVLLRPSGTLFQVYALRRLAAMVFGGVYAFPGGSVDPADAVDRVGVGGGWADRLGVPERAAAAVVAAAVREVAEETGVRLDASLLKPWARWITPEFEPRRFDTWFFVAALPDGQEPQDISGEADRTVWITPADALAGYADGSMILLPPTVAMLRDLAAYPSIGAVLDAQRDAASPVAPRIEVAPDGSGRLHLP